jgi:hypothetical protein
VGGFHLAMFSALEHRQECLCYFASFGALSFAELLQLKMAHHDVHPFPTAQAFG